MAPVDCNFLLSDLNCNRAMQTPEKSVIFRKNELLTVLQFHQDILFMIRKKRYFEEVDFINWNINWIEPPVSVVVKDNRCGRYMDRSPGRSKGT